MTGSLTMDGCERAATSLGIVLQPWQVEILRRVVAGEHLTVSRGRRGGLTNVQSVVDQARWDASWIVRCSVCGVLDGYLTEDGATGRRDLHHRAGWTDGLGRAHDVEIRPPVPVPDQPREGVP